MNDFTFAGLRTTLDSTRIVEGSTRLKAFRSRLVARGVDEVRAQSLVERLVLGAWGTFGDEYVAQMDGAIGRITRAQRELRSRLDRILKLRPGEATPPELSARELARLQFELEQGLTEVTGRSPTRAAEGARAITDDEVREYTSGLEPPEYAPRNTVEEPDDELSRQDDPLRRGADIDARGRATARAAALQQRLGDGWTVVLDRARNIEQARGLAALDPDFAANGFEIVITSPDGTHFHPDGVHFIGDPDQGGSFEFLEWKGLTDDPNAFNYTSGETAFRELKDDIEADVARAPRFARAGCIGFVWVTDSVKMFAAFQEAAADIHTRGVTFLGPR